jgi:hypothetical protein
VIALSRLAYMVCPCSSVHFTHVVIIGFLWLASAPSGQNCNASSMHGPIAVDKNWITALLCQQYYRHSQPPFVSGRSISRVWRPYKKSKRPRRESVRVGRSSASAVLLSVAPRVVQADPAAVAAERIASLAYCQN